MHFWGTDHISYHFNLGQDDNKGKEEIAPNMQRAGIKDAIKRRIDYGIELEKCYEEYMEINKKLRSMWVRKIILIC